MHYAFGDYDSLPRTELEGAIFQIDEQTSFDDVEELIFFLVLVPVVFAFDDSQAHNGIVHFTQRLVKPLVCAGIGDSLFVDDLQRGEENVQPGFVGEFFQLTHDGS